MTIDLTGSPYSIEGTGRWVIDEAARLQQRANLLRNQGRLTKETLRAYFGDKRFEQIAESNAIEGSTLSVGETQLAILRGVTITGHDPAYSEAAVNLSKALERMVDLASDQASTDIGQVKELHALILGGTPAAGLFRSEPVLIAGSPHTPVELVARDHDGDGSTGSAWSGRKRRGPGTPSRHRPAHVAHPHPPVHRWERPDVTGSDEPRANPGRPTRHAIIRRKDRSRYYEALAESDLGGDLGLVAELILARAEDALRDLERAATAQQDYDRPRAELRKAQERRVAIWNDAVRLLFTLVDEALQECSGRHGSGSSRIGTTTNSYSMTTWRFPENDSAGNSWLFRLEADVPGRRDPPLPRLDRIPERRDAAVAGGIGHGPVDLLVDPGSSPDTGSGSRDDSQVPRGG